MNQGQDFGCDEHGWAHPGPGSAYSLAFAGLPVLNLGPPIELRTCRRYQSSAEAFMAFGGRAGFPLKSSDFQKALRDLAVKARQAKPAVVIDVNGLMADIEKSYHGGLTFPQVWPLRRSLAPPSPSPFFHRRHRIARAWRRAVPCRAMPADSIPYALDGFACSVPGADPDGWFLWRCREPGRH